MKRAHFQTVAQTAATMLLPLAVHSACGSEADHGSQVGPDDVHGSGGRGDSGSQFDTGGTGNGTGGTIDLGDASMGRGAFPTDVDGACGQSVIDSAPRPVNVLVVLDRSGSMTTALETGTRWTAVKAALTTSLRDTQDTIDFGLDGFPSSGCAVPTDPALEVPVSKGAAGVDAIVAALGAKGPVTQGGTPTAAALARAVTFFQSTEGKALDGDRYVLLATDGGPNCNSAHAECAASACVVNMEGACPIPNSGNCCTGDVANCLDDTDTVARIKALADLGVHTFVVGIPGSEAFKASLDAFAVAGKEPRSGDTRYFAVTSSAELADSLRGITRSLVKTCDLVLQSEPPDPGALNVEIDGEVVPQAGADGWDLDVAASPPTVRLKGATCAAVSSKGAEQVRIIYGCPTVTTR